MSLGIVAALTPDHWDIEILDENFERFEYREADIVGFTALTSSVNRAYKLAYIYRKKNIPTVIGGIHASMLPDEALQYMDTVVIGEAESVWKKVILDFENNKLQKIYKGVLQPMSESPSPRIDLYNPGYKFGSVQTTRGCPMNCEFCSVPAFNGHTYRERPIENVIDDFEAIPQQRIYVTDDNLIGYSKKSAERAISLFKGMIKRGIKKDWLCSASMNIGQNEEVLKYAAEAGCKMIFLGIESELIDQLEAVNKKMNLKIGIDNFRKVFDKIHKYGIAVLGAFIYGIDSDTAKTLENRTNYILNADIDAMQTTVLTPLPGTKLFKRFQNENRLLFDNFPKDWERYDYVEVVYKPKLMAAKELEVEIKKSWRKLYNEKILKRRIIKTIKATGNPTAAIWAFGANLLYYDTIFENAEDMKNIRNNLYQMTRLSDSKII